MSTTTPTAAGSGHKVGDVITITVGFSEAACAIRAAGKTMQAHLHQHMVQLLDTDGGPYSAPITYGEAGIAHIYRQLNPATP
ncbi:hypothetical protein ACFVYG_32405 [Streptomyces sp. NPDC058256]|uniref:hypothetical protein n=1 Tax=Streptomyces sp. NPDC058256 TaxID=3346408 RepID=UPI0036E2F8F0